MKLTKTLVLLDNGYLAVDASAAPEQEAGLGLDLLKNRQLLTVVSNITYYGYMPNVAALQRLSGLQPQKLAAFWGETEPALKELTKDNRQMGDFVVYHNFPQEVLDMSTSEYWGRQILIYFGFDKSFVNQPKEDRPALFEDVKLKTLQLAASDTPLNIFYALLANKSRWSDVQLAQAKFLAGDLQLAQFSMEQVGFRENGIQLAAQLFNSEDATAVAIQDATDVLRLAALLSDADVSLRTKVKFKSFKRRQRRRLCQMLEGSKHLEADLAERQGLWKRLLSRLHPGETRKYPRVSQAYDRLYRGQLKSYASRVEAGIRDENVEVLTLLQGRPGEFARRLHHLYTVFGQQAVTVFSPVMEKLTTSQLLRLVGYAETLGERKTLAFAPRGNWTKLQIQENTKKPFQPEALAVLQDTTHQIINERLRAFLPEGVALDPTTIDIKLQTNDQELASYGRGTSFSLPANVTFLRTASYWENSRHCFFDNGWNFFDAEWNSLGACCWDIPSFTGRQDYSRYEFYYSKKDRRKARSAAGAIFSGDAINSHDKKGRACQMIDLYIDRLVSQGVRYAVWNILSYSNIPFDEAGEVLATLQWGEKPEAGKLYEPKRAQMVFPLTGTSKTKYIAYLDLVERKLIYIDANLKGNIGGAGRNGSNLQTVMPAFLEYLDTLPSVADLFIHADPGTIPVLFSDKDVELTEGQRAYVFRPENENNEFTKLELAELLGS